MSERVVAWGAGRTQCRVVYTESRAASLPRIEQAAYHRWRLPSGDDWITFHRDGEAYVLQFPGLARFRLSAASRQVHGHALRDVPEATFRHLFWNSVLPLAASGQRATVLHAGAVEVDAGAVAFLGPTGRGKSTLTAALAANGHRFLTDDALQVGLSGSGQPVVAPGQAHLRLWKDSERALAASGAGMSDATSKCRIPAGPRFPHCEGERVLTAIYLLAEGGSAQPSFERVRPAEALLELVRNAFLLDPESSELLKVQHDKLAAVVRAVPVFRMSYARNYDRLAQVCRETVAHARTCRPHP